MVEPTWVIYGIKCEHSSKYRYVGMTKGTATSRLKSHWGQANRGKSSGKYDWMRSHDPSEITVVVLEKCVPETRENLASREIFWITDLTSQGHSLLNHTTGGDGGDTFSGRTHSEAAKRKVRDSKLGKPRPESVKKAVKDSLHKYTFGETCCISCRREFSSPKGCSNHIASVHLGGNTKRAESTRQNWKSNRYNPKRKSFDPPTECSRGHDLSGENLWISPAKDKWRCKECNKLNMREQRKRKSWNNPNS